MKYLLSLFTLIFISLSLQAKELETYQVKDSLWLDNLDSIAVIKLYSQEELDSLYAGKIRFYRGDVEFIDRLRQNEEDKEGEGRVKVFQDSIIDALLKIDRAENLDMPGFQGYRIQVFSGGSRDRERASLVKEDLKEQFPDERVYVKYQAPDFRVRIGNFRTKFEAVSLYKQCLKIYPDCYLVKDQINLVDLEEEKEEEPITDEEME